MINRTTLIGLAVVTFVLLIINAAMGQDFGEGNAFLWTLGDIAWGGLLACGLALIVLTIGVLVRALLRSRETRSSSA